MKVAEVRALDTAEKRLAVTEYFVEATDEEAFQLWKDTHDSVAWEQCHGWLVTVGRVRTLHIFKSRDRIERHPVTVTFTWQLLDGHLVAFYDAASQVVDYRMVDRYVRRYVRQLDGRSAHTNATNFHHCMHALGLKYPERKSPSIGDAGGAK